MSVGNLRSLNNLLLKVRRVLFDAKSNIVSEAIVEEDSLLVHVSDELTQRVQAEVFYVDAIDEHFAFLYVVVARDKIDERRLSASALSHQRNGFSLRDDEVDVFEHPLFPIAERHMTELYLMFERIDADGVFLLLDVNLRQQNLIDALHRGQAFRNVIARLRELLQRFDDGVENRHVVDERRTRQRLIAQHEDSTEPKHDDNHHRSKELRHRMGKTLTDVHSHDIIAISRVHGVETFVHLLLSTERLDDAQSAQRLLHLTHRVAPQGLCLDGLLLQLASHESHEPAEQRYEDNREQRELPRDDEQRDEIDDDENRILEQHVERRHDGILYLLHITAHACNDITLTLLAEEAQREGSDFLIELIADVAHHTSSYRDDGGRRQEVGTRLQSRHHRQHNADDE